MKGSVGWKISLRKRALGTYEHMGFVPKAFLYALLISIGFVYIYPLLSMAVMSLESLEDLLDSSVKWLPHTLHLDNYRKALDVMKFDARLIDTLKLTLLPSLAQMVSCALSGYALARFHFKGRGLIMGLVLVTFIVPFPVMMVPTYVQYTDYGVLGTIWTLVLPALGGQGLRAAIFILIFKAFYEQTPQSLDEAARVDGAGEARIFFTIGLPLGISAMVTTFLFSFVWYWNEVAMNNLFVSNMAVPAEKRMYTLVMALSSFEASYSEYSKSQAAASAAVAGAANAQNEAITMAGTLLVIAVPLIVYFVLQRYFVEAIDRSGITGE